MVKWHLDGESGSPPRPLCRQGRLLHGRSLRRPGGVSARTPYVSEHPEILYVTAKCDTNIQYVWQGRRPVNQTGWGDWRWRYEWCEEAMRAAGFDGPRQQGTSLMTTFVSSLRTGRYATFCYVICAIPSERTSKWGGWTRFPAGWACIALLGARIRGGDYAKQGTATAAAKATTATAQGTSFT